MELTRDFNFTEVIVNVFDEGGGKSFYGGILLSLCLPFSSLNSQFIFSFSFLYFAGGPLSSYILSFISKKNKIICN